MTTPYALREPAHYALREPTQEELQHAGRSVQLGLTDANGRKFSRTRDWYGVTLKYEGDH